MASNTINDCSDDCVSLEDNNPDVGSSSDRNQQSEDDVSELNEPDAESSISLKRRMVPDRDNQQLQKHSRQEYKESDLDNEDENGDEENEDEMNEHDDYENVVNHYEEIEDEDDTDDRALQFAKRVVSNIRVLDPVHREIMMKQIMFIVFTYELKNMNSDYGSRKI